MVTKKPILHQSMEPLGAAQSQARNTHHLPAISASQALRRIHVDASHAISTGISTLDELLRGPTKSNIHGLPSVRPAGLSRGKITELVGVSGSGKTTIALHIAASALLAGNSVSWLGTRCDVPSSRLQTILQRYASRDEDGTNTIDDHLRRFRQCHVPSLAHLLALLQDPPPKLILSTASVLVIDSMSALMDACYPSRSVARSMPNHRTNEDNKAPSWRKDVVVTSLLQAMHVLAAQRNIAILTTSQMMTRILRRQGTQTMATLVPSLGLMGSWIDGVWTRIVLYRDSSAHVDVRSDSGTEPEHRSKIRYICILKMSGETSLSRPGIGTGLAFHIAQDGIHELKLRHAGDDDGEDVSQDTRAHLKRAFGEIGDSDDDNDAEEFGWGAGDDIVAEGLIDALDDEKKT